MTTAPRVLFEEEQRFRQPWLRALIIGASLVFVGVAVWAVVQQLGYGIPFGNSALPDSGIVTLATMLVLLGLGLAWLFLTARLHTVVREDGLFVRFSPFHRRPKQLGPARLLRWHVREYRALREYGGWGIRYGREGKAYNVSGDRGVQLEYSDGERVLLGSQRAAELCRAIDLMMEPRL